MRNSLLLLISLLVLSALPFAFEKKQESDNSTLKEYANKMHFLVGVPLPGRIIAENPRYLDTAKREFNSFEAIAVMAQTQPERGEYNFRGMDKDIQLAKEEGVKLYGKSLIYSPQSSPQWLIGPMRGNPNGGWSESELDKITKDSITTVIRHGGDNYIAWEVVNEPLNRHNNPWDRVMGHEEYIAKAFQYAHDANPNIDLVLNETFGHQGLDKDRVDEFFDLVKKVKAKGGPISAVGSEMHLEMPLRPTYLDEFRDFLNRARQAGVHAYVTEMDVYQGSGNSANAMQAQAKIYHDVVSACAEDSNCKGWYTWGTTDAFNFPARRPRDPLTDAKPLLFDENYQKKPAYYSVLDALKEAASSRR